MLVLVEGADGTGKTTLIKQLQEYGFMTLSKVIEDTGNKNILNLGKIGDYNFEVLESWEYCSKFFKKIYLVDRSFISEIVYSIVLYRPTNLKLESWITYLKNYETKVIHCVSDTAYDDAMRRGETHITDKRVHKKLELCYDTVIDVIRKFTYTNTFRYDYKKNDIKEVVKFIVGE